jgi:hypothetical protein
MSRQQLSQGVPVPAKIFRTPLDRLMRDGDLWNNQKKLASDVGTPLPRSSSV